MKNQRVKVPLNYMKNKSEKLKSKNESIRSSATKRETSDILASLNCFIHKDYVILQDKKYKEDGWFIKIISNQVQLWEIPQYGGEPNIICTYPCVTSAYRRAITLS